MPKVLKDEALQNEVREIVREAGGFTAASNLLHVNKVALWRFHETGCAILRTRTIIKNAVEHLKSETKFQKRETNEINQQVGVQLADLGVIRSFCQSMIALVDAYERIAGSQEPAAAMTNTLPNQESSANARSGKRN